MAAARHCPSWADLQPELLGLVLGRLPSLSDRVRLAAVCRPWRHSARLEPVPPPFPWLTLRDGTFFSIPDSKIYRLPLVPPDNSRCIGSVGNWLFLEQHIGEGSLLSLMNLFSKNVLQLPDANTIWCHEPVNGYRSPYTLVKLVLLSPMDPSPDSLFAVLITDCMSENVISICQVSTASAFRVLHREGGICDVAFVDGKLYALSTTKLFVFEAQSSGKCKRKIPSMKCIANDVIRQTFVSERIREYEIVGYLVESSGKLLYVRRLIKDDWSISPRENQSRTFSFDVFEVDLTNPSSVQWSLINSLEGEALFIGPYSKALHASEYGAQADCIYFMCDYGSADPFRDSGVFNMRNGTIMPLLPETMVTQASESIAKERSADKFYSAFASWFFPY